MDFSIIIVSWNVKDKLRENLLSIFQASQKVTFEVIVIDNASSDGTEAMINSEFLDVKLISNQENVGFAKASNQGLTEAKGDFLILLNPDMKLQTDTLHNLKDWLEKNPQADVTGIKLVDDKNRLVPQVRKFPSVWDQLTIILKLPHIFPQLLSSYLQENFNYEQASKVNSIRGAFFVIRRTSLQRFGYFDERYFLWFEEVDYCHTVTKQGGEVWYTPVATAVDYIGQSFSQLPRAKKQIYFRNSMLAYFKKWGSPWQILVLSIAWEISEAIVQLGDLLKIEPRAKT